MTTLQIIVFTCAYAVALAATVYFTRAPSRRVMGALAGGAAAGCFGMGAIILGNALGVWRVPLSSTPGVLGLFYVGLAISCSPIYLISWRLARRFRWRGVAVCLVVVGVIGLSRDYLYAALYPEWRVFAKGVAPMLADAATYLDLVLVGHAVMWGVSGGTREDHLVRRPSAA